jgi:hypothetical protein
MMDELTKTELLEYIKHTQEVSEILWNGIQDMSIRMTDDVYNVLEDKNEAIHLNYWPRVKELIDHSPRFTPQPVKESDYVCCS